MIFFNLTVDQFFTDFFSKIRMQFSWSNLIILLIGVMLGFILFGLFYTILMVSSLRFDKKLTVTIELDHEHESELIIRVDKIKKQYLTNSLNLRTKEKLQVLSNNIYEMINTIASYYYPDSPYPLYELTIEELLTYLHYLSNRIESIFDKRILRPFKKMSVTQIFKFLDLKKKIDENKIIKAAKTAQASKIKKIFFSTINYANPLYWFKNLILNSAYNYTIDKISLIILDMVADETNKAYSKRIFNQELGLQTNQINDALKQLEEEKDDEK